MTTTKTQTDKVEATPDAVMQICFKHCKVATFARPERCETDLFAANPECDVAPAAVHRMVDNG